MISEIHPDFTLFRSAGNVSGVDMVILPGVLLSAPVGILLKEVRGMSILTITQDNFAQEVLSSKEPVLVDFWASWCGPCRMMAPILDQLADAHPEIRVGKVNVDEQPDLASQFQVMSIPTLILFRNGKPAATSIGVRPMGDLEQMIRE